MAQEFLPTTFDWRIGILDRPAAVRLQVLHGRRTTGRSSSATAPASQEFGKFETMPVELAPRRRSERRCKAANLIGDGLYGVDVKQSSDKFYVIEVNDNPNIDAGVEDAVLKDELYRRIMHVFLARIEQQKAGVRIA